MRFYGNVEVGTDITHAELLQWYDSIIYASGANSDHTLGIPGEELPGSWSAREFVAWYNGHPDFSHLVFDLSADRAVIVGNGNVALDVARILLLPIEQLRKTDIADHAIEALSHSQIKEVVILGRRGYQYGAYHNPELEEFSHLDDVEIQIDDPDFTNVENANLDHLSWEARRKIETLKNLTANTGDRTSKRIVFKFLTSPTAFQGKHRLQQVLIRRNGLEPNALDVDDGKYPIRKGSSQTSAINAGIVFRSIGYCGAPFPELPFNESKGVIENINGRVSDKDRAIPGAYVTGWIKRGANGVIGTNKQCAFETVSCLLDDLSSTSCALPGDLVLKKVRDRKPDFVSLNGWLNIDRAERSEGLLQQRTRSKLCNIDDMLKAAHA